MWWILFPLFSLTSLWTSSSARVAEKIIDIDMVKASFRIIGHSRCINHSGSFWVTFQLLASKNILFARLYHLPPTLHLLSSGFTWQVPRVITLFLCAFLRVLLNLSYFLFEQWECTIVHTQNTVSPLAEGSLYKYASNVYCFIK